MSSALVTETDREVFAAGLKKGSFEAMRLASRERVQQRLPPGLRAADGGSTVAEAVGEARLPGIAKRSTSTASEFAVSSGQPWSARRG